jgi:hypothetical protein
MSGPGSRRASAAPQAQGALVHSGPSRTAGEDGRRLEPVGVQVDAKRQLPDELGDGGKCPATRSLDRWRQTARRFPKRRSEDLRRAPAWPSPWHQAGPVHQVPSISPFPMPATKPGPSMRLYEREGAERDGSVVATDPLRISRGSPHARQMDGPCRHLPRSWAPDQATRRRQPARPGAGMVARRLEWLDRQEVPEERDEARGWGAWIVDASRRDRAPR